MLDDRALSVSQLNEYARRLMAGDPILSSLRVRGEISGFKRHTPSGHLYFSIKDSSAKVDCCMFRQNAVRLNFEPRDGMMVILSGSAGLYTQAGKFQVYVQAMEREGQGELFRRFLELKDRLLAEGLFDASRKKPLPLLPRRVGIVTSASGAALRDIVRVANRRYPGMPLLLCAAQVQGTGAAATIVRAIQLLDAVPDVDVILVGRGGGALEDLWAFNEESVARAIAACATPVVSGVGHETDTSIADFVADVRAATPSQAAEYAIPEKKALLDRLKHDLARMDWAQQNRLQRLRARVDRAAGSKAMRDAANLGSIRRQQLGQLRVRLDAGFKRQTDRALREVVLLHSRLKGGMERTVSGNRLRVERAQAALASLDPTGVLRRGYAVVSTESGIVDNAEALSPGQNVEIRLRGGRAGAQIQKVWRDSDGGEKNQIV